MIEPFRTIRFCEIQRVRDNLKRKKKFLPHFQLTAEKVENCINLLNEQERDRNSKCV